MLALKGAILSRAEVNAGLAEMAAGCLTLRYDVPDAVSQEFWVHRGRRDHAAFRTGQVSVQAK